MAKENEIVLEEFLISSQPYPMLISQEQISKTYGKEAPAFGKNSWQWLYRFPNGLGASVVRFNLKAWEQGADRYDHEVTIVQWNGERWTLLQGTDRRVLEADLEAYLGMIRDIPPEDTERFVKMR
ncbi:MAG: hypothetical protein SA339_10620 [Methanomassiliicoccus sp.]|nr:hypothetical protein [Methanomassiliicoccus sp.]